MGSGLSQPVYWWWPWLCSCHCGRSSRKHRRALDTFRYGSRAASKVDALTSSGVPGWLAAGPNKNCPPSHGPHVLRGTEDMIMRKIIEYTLLSVDGVFDG